MSVALPRCSPTAGASALCSPIPYDFSFPLPRAGLGYSFPDPPQAKAGQSMRSCQAMGTAYVRSVQGSVSFTRTWSMEPTLRSLP